MVDPEHQQAHHICSAMGYFTLIDRYFDDIIEDISNAKLLQAVRDACRDVEVCEYIDIYRRSAIVAIQSLMCNEIYHAVLKASIFRWLTGRADLKQFAQDGTSVCKTDKALAWSYLSQELDAFLFEDVME